MAFPAGSKSSLVTVDYTKIVGSADLTSFRVPIDGASVPASVFAAMQGDGDDIRVTTDEAGTNEVAFEVVAIDKGALTCEIWVILNLSYTVDTLFYLWYGDASLSAYARTATYGSDNVWGGSEFRLHMEGNSNDSHASANDATDTNMGYGAAHGVLGQGATFDGTAYMDFSNTLKRQGKTNWTMSFFFKTGSAGLQMLYSEGNTSLANPLHQFYITGGQLNYGIRNDGGTSNSMTSSSSSYADDALHHAVVRKSGTSFTMRIDKSAQASMTSSLTPTINRCGLGALLRSGQASLLSGEIDEFDYDGIARPTDWTDTEYNAVMNPDTFLTVAEAPPDVGGAGFLMNFL